MFLSETNGSQGQNTKKLAYRLESFHFYHHFCNSRYPSLNKPFFGLISHQIISILHFIERTIPYFESTTNTSKKHIRIHQIDNVRLYSSLILGFLGGWFCQHFCHEDSGNQVYFFLSSCLESASVLQLFQNEASTLYMNRKHTRNLANFENKIICKYILT